jgi:hypothetical protein
MYSEAYFDQPAQEYSRLLEFLGLRPFEPAGFGRFNARPGAPMPPRTRQMLEEYYIPHNARLSKLLDVPPRWAR